jgi:VIT1/CCC1 family predicted Fe2+/Mn2+ transporter
MVEIVSAIIPSRNTVRNYVEGKRSVLEMAQANGRLARVKIDLKDEANAVFAVGTVEEKEALRSMLDEEIEALCADLRLASVTVQAQVERRSRNFARGALIAIGVFVVVIVLCVAANVQDGIVGFGVPLIAAIIALFVFS